MTVIDALIGLGICIALAAVVRIRDVHRRPRYQEQRRSMATRIVRPYAIVEAYDKQGEPVSPTIVYDADQLDLAAQRYVELGCSVVVGTVIDVVH